MVVVIQQNLEVGDDLKTFTSGDEETKILWVMSRFRK